MKPVAVLGMPRVVDFPSDVEFGQCASKDCTAELGWSRSCPKQLPKLCVSCVMRFADAHPLALILLAGGQRMVRAADIQRGTTH